MRRLHIADKGRQLAGLATLFLLWACTVAEAAFSLHPMEVAPGGIAMLRWEGDAAPPSRYDITFRDQPVAVYAGPDGVYALIGVDMETAAGSYPIRYAVRTTGGGTLHGEIPLAVAAVERPAERLSLPKQMATPTDPAILKRIARERKRLGEVFAGRSEQLFWSDFVRPVDAEVGSPFGLRRILNGVAKSPHNGVDFRAGAGAPVIAAGRGTVVLADDLYYTGKTVIVDHGGGLFSLYAHLRRIVVGTGAAVDAGEQLGEVGSTGRSTGPHLHFGVRLASARIDPLALIALVGK